MKAAKARDVEMIKKSGIDVCMECGSCYACPSGLPLVQHMRLAKQILERRDKTMADNNLMTISASPHVRAHRTTGVCLMLFLHLSVFSCRSLLFGIRALWVVLVCRYGVYLNSLPVKYLKEVQQSEVSAVVTGLLRF